MVFLEFKIPGSKSRKTKPTKKGLNYRPSLCLEFGLFAYPMFLMLSSLTPKSASLDWYFQDSKHILCVIMRVLFRMPVM